MLLLALGSLSAWAQEGVIGVMQGVPVDDPRLKREIVEVLTQAGYEKALLMEPGALAAEVQLATVRSDPPPCRQPLDSWLVGLDMAVGLVGEGELEEAQLLSSQLERDLSCLQGVPSPEQLGHFWLLQAQIASAGEEEGNSWGSVPVAIKRAAAIGVGSDDGLDPDILSQVVATRRRLPEPIRLVVTGPGASQLRVDGAAPRDGILEVIPGEHRLWLTDGSQVLRANAVSFSQSAVLWIGEGAPGSLEEVVAALPKRAPTPAQQMLLTAYAKAVEQPVVFLGIAGYRVDLWKADGPNLIRWETGKEVNDFGGDQVDVWRAVYGIGLSGGWTNQEELMGAGGGLGAYARWRLNDRLQFAFSTFPLLKPSGDVFQANVPFRFGLRYGRTTARWTADLGIDVGMEWRGAWDPRSTGLLLGGGVGASGAIGPRTGARVELWGAASLDHAVFGLWLGVEGRLKSRATFLGG